MPGNYGHFGVFSLKADKIDDQIVALFIDNPSNPMLISVFAISTDQFTYYTL